MRRILALVPLLGILPACIVEAPTSEKSSPAQSRTQVKAVPVKNGAVLDDLAELVGATFAPPSVTPGDSTRVVLVFRAIKPATEDWQVFVHVEDADGRLERMNLDHRPAGGAYPTTQWKKGETIRDDFVLYLPPGAQIRGLNIWLGLWEPVSDTRLPLKNPEAVRHDGKDRILVARVPVAAG